jgi:nucleoid-associated protein YgaU
MTGDNQPATLAAVPPANPSRDNPTAVVQVGTAAAMLKIAATELTTLFFSLSVFATVIPRPQSSRISRRRFDAGSPDAGLTPEASDRPSLQAAR